MGETLSRRYPTDMPRADEAEAALLGALLLEPERVDQVKPLEPKHFFLEPYRALYAALREMRAAGEAIDLVTVAAWLERGKQLEFVGGRAHLARLLNATPSAKHAAYYANLIYDASIRRELWRICANLSTLVWSEEAKQDALRAAIEYSLAEVRAAFARVTLSERIPTTSADNILTAEHPEPLWAVPRLLPVGLTILAGAPKLGKSWLALQIAQAVAAGGCALGEKVERGPVLYLALEDSPRRLRDRMQQQGWPVGLDVDFLTIGEFSERLGDLDKQGGVKLARQIGARRYRLVVIDTLSRAFSGDRNDVQQITRSLMPLQEVANAMNVAILLIHHYRKLGAFTADVASDILGSTAKGAMCDTVWGLYRERGRAGAKLVVTGREVEPRTLALKMDWPTGVWHCKGQADVAPVSQRRQEILDALKELGRAQLAQIVRQVGGDEGNTHRSLRRLVAVGLIERITEAGKVYYTLPHANQAQPAQP